MSRSRNDVIMLGMVAVLIVTVVAIAVLEYADRDTGEVLSHVAIGIVGAVAGYVTAGRSKADTSDTNPGYVSAAASYDLDDDPDDYESVWDEDEGVDVEDGHPQETRNA